MKQEEKELLLKDLCGRLPYLIKGIITYDESNTTFTVEGIDNNVLHLSDSEECYVEDFKSYLRPMSSMTEDEKKIYNHRLECMFYDSAYDAAFAVDWLLEHHFDYRGLIEKGLALEAPEEMYNN